MSISGLPQGRGKMRAPTPAPPSRFSAAFAASVEPSGRILPLDCGAIKRTVSSHRVLTIAVPTMNSRTRRARGAGGTLLPYDLSPTAPRSGVCSCPHSSGPGQGSRHSWRSRRSCGRRRGTWLAEGRRLRSPTGQSPPVRPSETLNGPLGVRRAALLDAGWGSRREARGPRDGVSRDEKASVR